MNIDVSIIIVNYNTLELTKNTINSVIEKTRDLNYEVILVDNASTDGSVEFFEREYTDKIIFIKNNENLGFGKANNKGIEISKGKYIFLLNSDTLLINNAIKILFDYMEDDYNCGVCGGNLFDLELNPTHSFVRKLPTLKTEINVLKRVIDKLIIKNDKRKDFNYSNVKKEVGYITGADMMIRKSILDKVGLFDKDFFMYFEETELTYRIKKFGYKIISIPTAKIIHLEGKSTAFKEKKIKMFLESKYKYLYKISGLNSCKLYNFVFKNELMIKRIILNREEDKKIITINRNVYKEFLLNYKNLGRKD